MSLRPRGSDCNGYSGGSHRTPQRTSGKARVEDVGRSKSLKIVLERPANSRTRTLGVGSRQSSNVRDHRDEI